MIICVDDMFPIAQPLASSSDLDEVQLFVEEENCGTEGINKIILFNYI